MTAVDDVTEMSFATRRLRPGVSIARVWESEDDLSSRQAFIYTLAPCRVLSDDDMDAEGPTDLIVVSGTFHGLAGTYAVYETGDFIHYGAGSPASLVTLTGGQLLVCSPPS